MPDFKEIIIVSLIFIIPVFIALPLQGNLQKLNQQQNSKVSPFIKPLEFFKSQDVLWIDARSAKKFNQKHIPGAINVSQYNWEAGLESLFINEKFAANPAVMLAVYCDEGCHDSEAVAVRLREALQSENVYILKGGMDIWFESQQ